MITRKISRDHEKTRRKKINNAWPLRTSVGSWVFFLFVCLFFAYMCFQMVNNNNNKIVKLLNENGGRQRKSCPFLLELCSRMLFTTSPSIPCSSLKGESSIHSRSDIIYSMAAFSFTKCLVRSYFCVKCADHVQTRLQTTARMFCVSASRSSKYSHSKRDVNGSVLHNSVELTLYITFNVLQF